MSDAISREEALAELERHAKGGTTIGGQTFRTIQLGEATEAISALPAVTPGVRVKPTDAQVASACLSYRHDFGLLDGLERTLVLHQAREWLHAWQKELDLTPHPAPTGTTAVPYHAPIRVCPICDIAECAKHRDQPQPAPDLAGLVEAAKALRDLAIQNTDNREEWDAVIAKLDFALAAMEGKP